MSDGQTLFLILSLLYLSECFLWIGKGTVAFISPWRRKWHVSFGSFLLENTRGGFVLLNPLFPLGSVFLSHLSPISFSPKGICAYHLQSLPGNERKNQSGNFLAFEEVTAVGTEGAHLSLNRSRFTKCATEGEAKILSGLIQSAIGQPAAGREAMIHDFLDRQFNKKEVSAILSETETLTAHLKWLSLFFFVLLFGIVPALVMTYGLTELILPVAVAMVALAVGVSIRFYRTHKRLYPLRRSDRISNVAKMLLCPPAAIRAADLLTTEAVSQFNPVVVATLLSGSDASPFVHAFIRDLKHPLRHDLADKQSLEVARWYAEKQLDRCLTFLKEEGQTDPDSILLPPPQDAACGHYCPRCGSQFTAASTECPDCPGVGLVSYGPRRDEGAFP